MTVILISLPSSVYRLNWRPLINSFNSRMSKPTLSQNPATCSNNNWQNSRNHCRRKPNKNWQHFPRSDRQKKKLLLSGMNWRKRNRPRRLSKLRLVRSTCRYGVQFPVGLNVCHCSCVRCCIEFQTVIKMLCQ